MGHEMFQLHTDEALLRAVRNAAQPTTSELKQQRVSFVYGALDSENSMTRDQVERMIESADVA